MVRISSSPTVTMASVPSGVSKNAWQLLSIFLATIVGIITQPLSLPLVKSLCVAYGSNVGDGTQHKLGSWLMLTCFQISVISLSMFLTAMGANPLSANITFNTIQQTIGWTDWAKAAIVPGFVSLLVVPFLLYMIYPSPKLAKEKLQKMGPMAGTLLLTVGLWIFGGVINVDAITAGILGLSVLLITGVVTWKECLAKSVAWDTLTWFIISVVNIIIWLGVGGVWWKFIGLW